jgi:transposase
VAKNIKVNPADIVILEGTYPRTKSPWDLEEAAQEKAVAHLRGVSFPNVVTANGGTNLVDGAHRVLALILDGVKEIEVQDLGTKNADQILREAIKRNATHGKQLSLAEKAKLARKLESTVKQKDMAKLFAVSERTISRWVEEVKEARRISTTKKALKLIELGNSVNAAAKELGVSRSTLDGWLKQADGDPTFTKPVRAKKKAEKKAKAKAAPKAPKVDGGTLEDAIDEIVLTCYTAIKAAAKAHDAEVEEIGFEVIKLINERL